MNLEMIHQMEDILMKLMRSRRWVINHNSWSGDNVASFKDAPREATLNLTELAKEIIKEK